MKRNITSIVIHCTATREDQHLTPMDLITMHRKRGFHGCGYHWYITRDGEIHPMRPESQVGAHAKGHNENSIGIAYEGGLDVDGRAKDTRTGQQKRSLRVLIRVLMTEYPITCVVGHRDLSPDLNGNGIVEPHEWTKMCPCFDVQSEYHNLVRMMIDRRGVSEAD